MAKSVATVWDSLTPGPHLAWQGQQGLDRLLSPSPLDALREGLTCTCGPGAPSKEAVAGLVPPSRGEFGNGHRGLFLIITMRLSVGWGVDAAGIWCPKVRDPMHSAKLASSTQQNPPCTPKPRAETPLLPRSLVERIVPTADVPLMFEVVLRYVVSLGLLLARAGTQLMFLSII